MTSFLSPTFWGSLFALVVGIILMPIGVALNGLPTHAGTLPDGAKYVSVFSISAITLVYTLRYYCLLSLNVFEDDITSYGSLPSSLRKLIFALLATLSLLCLICAGAIVGISFHLALITCAAMSFLSLMCWLVCSILSAVDFWPKISKRLGPAELVLLALAIISLVAVLNFSYIMVSLALPLLAFLAMFVFANEFSQIYYKKILDHGSKLAAHMNDPGAGSSSTVA